MPKLMVGEPAPWFSVPHLGHTDRIVLDELAGRTIVLIFCESPNTPAAEKVLQEFALHSDLFGLGQAILIMLCWSDEIVPPSFANRDGWFFGQDLRGTLAKRYGLAAEGDINSTFVLSPALQVLAIASGDAQIAAGIIPMLMGFRSHPYPAHDAPVLILPHVFDADFCAALIAGYQVEGGREIGAIENSGKIVERFDPAFRKRLDWYISNDDTVRQCRDMLVNRLLPIIQRAFQFRTTRIERYLVGCYDAASGGHFHAHRDNTSPLVAHRRFAVTINLNDAYEGGDLSFPEFGARTYRPGIGSAAVFSCSLLHQVAPLTSGTRYAFLTFVYDEEAQRIREQQATRMASNGPARDQA